MFHDLVGEDQVFQFIRGNGLVGGLFDFGIPAADFGVALLYGYPAQQRAELFAAAGRRLGFEDDAVFLGFEHGQRVVVVTGGHDDLEEYFVDFFGRGLVHRAVGDEHTAESRYGIAGQRVLPRFDEGRPHGYAAGVVVLHDDESRFAVAEFGDQVHGGVHVEHVVIADLLAVQLFELGGEVAEEDGRLVRVFAVAQVGRAGFGEALLEGGDALRAVEVVENGGVVVRADVERFGGQAAALFERGAAVLRPEQVEDVAVLVHGGYDRHVLVVFGGGADQRDAADVDFSMICCSVAPGVATVCSNG